MHQSITHAEAEKLMKQEKIMIVDLRNQESYQKGHIVNAIHLSMDKLREHVDQADVVYKSKPILVYCYHGISSKSVAEHLVEMGFQKVYSLIGGFEAWQVDHPISDAS